MTAEREKLCPYCGLDKSKKSYKLPNKLRVCEKCYVMKNPMFPYALLSYMRKKGMSKQEIDAIWGKNMHKTRADFIYGSPRMEQIYSLLMRGKKVDATRGGNQR